MGDKPFKKFEREIADLIGGRRHWANSGESIDCTSDRFVAQCKNVARMSLAEISDLAESVAAYCGPGDAAHGVVGRLGLVCLKLRRGKGKPSPTLVVMTSETFTRLTRYNPHP